MVSYTQGSFPESRGTRSGRRLSARFTLGHNRAGGCEMESGTGLGSSEIIGCFLGPLLYFISSLDVRTFAYAVSGRLRVPERVKKSDRGG